MLLGQDKKILYPFYYYFILISPQICISVMHLPHYSQWWLSFFRPYLNHCIRVIDYMYCIFTYLLNNEWVITR